MLPVGQFLLYRKRPENLRYIKTRGKCDRLPGISRFGLHKLIESCLDAFRDLMKKSRPLPNSGLPPFTLQCPACGADRGVNNSWTRFRDARDDRSISGIQIVEEAITAYKLSVHKVSKLGDEVGTSDHGLR